MRLLAYIFWKKINAIFSVLLQKLALLITKQYRYGTRQVNRRNNRQVGGWGAESDMTAAWWVLSRSPRRRHKCNTNDRRTTGRKRKRASNEAGRAPAVRVWSTRRRHPICRRAGDAATNHPPSERVARHRTPCTAGPQADYRQTTAADALLTTRWRPHVSRVAHSYF